jgi:4,5:9,10-diseco-3-hydroxy-5,9,17-trioxoandrosta-1(10),2-diene-4-oate hydrolase
MRHALGALPPFKETEVDGVRLVYNDDGEGPVVICLHAIGHGAGDYRAVSNALRGRYRVIALDWPGQGRSGEDLETASPWRYALLLEKFVDQLGLDRFVLVGNSIGGGAALRYTAAHSQHVRGLVLCNPQGLDRQDRIAILLCKGMARFFRAGARDAGWFRRAFEFYYRQVLPAPAADNARALIVSAGYESATILAQAWSSFADPHADARMLIPQIRCPVLFCWAMRDRFIPLSRNRPAVLRFANARIEKFEQSGHSAFLEQPEHFQHVLERFLDGLR